MLVFIEKKQVFRELANGTKILFSPVTPLLVVKGLIVENNATIAITDTSGNAWGCSGRPSADNDGAFMQPLRTQYCSEKNYRYPIIYDYYI